MLSGKERFLFGMLGALACAACVTGLSGSADNDPLRTWPVIQEPTALPALTLTRNGDAISGVLADEFGQPVGHALLNFAARDVNARMGPSSRGLGGTVPVGAATAVVGIRVGAEDACVCFGEAGAAVGGIHYREPETGRRQEILTVNPGVDGAPASVLSLRLTPGQPYTPNLGSFPVTPGAAFSFDAPIMATANAERAGYVVLVFEDAAGREISRQRLWFSPSQQDLAPAYTDADGRFTLQLPVTAALAEPEILASFAGAGRLGPGVSVLQPEDGDRGPMPALRAPAVEPASPGHPLLWFSPREDFLRALNDSTSWDQLEPQWSSAGHVGVLRLVARQVMDMPEDLLARLVHDLARKHIALGLEIGAVNWFHEQPCGSAVESYIDPESINIVVTKLMRAGGAPDLLTMDEPLYFGHYYSGRNACQNSIAELARRTAVILEIYHAAFPAAVVGDTEPFPALSSHPGWEADYAAWVQALHEAAGVQLGFLHLDFDWEEPALNLPGTQQADPAAIAALAQSAAAVARNNGLQVGFICNGNAGAADDSSWAAEARQHLDAVEASGIAPDQVLIETWAQHPLRTLPESDTGSLAGLLGYYVARYD